MTEKKSFREVVKETVLASALEGIISQKLARRLCDKCKQKRSTTDYEKEIFNSFDFYDLETIEETFKTIHDEKVSKLIYQRDLYAINKYKKMCKK